jgi:hypothetical protein
MIAWSGKTLSDVLPDAQALSYPNLLYADATPAEPPDGPHALNRLTSRALEVRGSSACSQFSGRT